MGEFADDLMNAMIDDMFDNDEDDTGLPMWRRGNSRGSRKPKTFQSGVGNYMWRQATGELINMHDMTEGHLANAAAMARRRGNTGKADQLEEVLAGRYNNVGYPSA